MKTINLDFLGKDSVRYCKDIELPDEVYDELKKLADMKNPGEEIFDRATSADVSAFLNEVHQGISPKVLRTAKCNKVLVENLKKQQVSKDATPSEKVRAMYRANLEIAKTLNHQKNVAKNFKEQEKKAEEKVDNQKQSLKDLVKKQKEKLEKIAADEKDVKVKYEKMPKIRAEKLSKLQERRQKLEAQVAKAEARIEKAEFNLTKKQETKDINLGTSLAAYADSRVIFSWCNDVGLDPKMIYTKALLEKFSDAADTPASFWKKI